MNHLEQRVLKLEKICDQLLSRICELEDTCAHLNEQLQRQQTQNTQIIEQINQPATNDEEIEETWLFYCKSHQSVQEIKSLLQFDRELIYEFDFKKWIDELSMWKDIGFKLSQVNYEKKTQQGIKSSVIELLNSLMHKNLLLIVRNFVINENVLILELCEVITNCWNNLELNDGIDGRILLVVESDQKLSKIEGTKDNQKITLFLEELK